MCVKCSKADRFLCTVFIEWKVKYFGSVYLKEKLTIIVPSKYLCKVNVL